MSERGWKEQPEREASLDSEGSKDSHPFVQSAWKFPRGLRWIKFCKPDLPKRLVLLIPLFPFLWF